MTSYYTTRRPPPVKPPYLMARLFIVTETVGARCVARPTLSSPQLAVLHRGTLFHGDMGATVDARWVERLPSEGGGYCYRGSVREL